MISKPSPLLCGPLLAVVIGFVLSPTVGVDAALTAAITACCIVWWFSEALPIPVTSLLPLALFPLLGILDATQVASAYGSPLILLMLGGFILSRGMASTGTHRRLAVAMVQCCRRVAGSDSDSGLVVGFMCASALLSMWISNTATVLMLLPIALAVLEQSDNKQLPLALMLGIAYAANVGGMGTPIGTPPNLVFMEVYAETTGRRMGFLEWMQIAVPVVLLFVPLIAWYLTRPLARHRGRAVLLPAVGDWRVEEKRVLWVFALTALAWITRGEPYGGWSGLFNLPQASDAAIALLAAIALFIVPNGRGGRLLDWQQANEIPWGMLLLFAGGLCIAKAFTVSGLSTHLADGVAIIGVLPLLLLLLILCLGVSFLTECTSNTATTVLLMPVLAAVALGLEIDPQLLMLPAALSASCAFMLPVATAPNAIVFGSGKIRSREMLQKGLLLNFIGAFIIATVSYGLLLP